MFGHELLAIAFRDEYSLNHPEFRTWWMMGFSIQLVALYRHPQRKQVQRGRRRRSLVLSFFMNPIGASVQAWGTILFRIVHARGVISNEGEGAQHCSITSITAVHRSFELRSSFSGAVVKRHACEARGIWVGPT